MNETTTFTDHTVAVYATHTQAENALKTLNSSGYNLKNLSIVGQNYASEEQPVGFVNTGERMWSWGKYGAFWGSIWGMLFGSAMLFIPGVGYFMFAGWLVAIIEGAAIGGGLAALVGALISLGIPKDTVVEYETALKAGSFLLLAHGSEAEVKRAKELMGDTSATRVDSFTTKQPAGIR